MYWLNFLGNEALLVLAETLVIIIGSMLLGILVSYFYWGHYKKEVEDQLQILDEEKKKTEELRDQISELLQVREHLKSEISENRLKADTQAKAIYETNLQLYNRDADFKKLQDENESLQNDLQSFRDRMNVLEEELKKPAGKPVEKPAAPVKRTPTIKARANYEHVSQLLGRQVTENDLTLILGIGPKTSTLLRKHKIRTWADLADTPAKKLREILDDAGGIYKSLDASTWAKQANMAAKSEWRKLRVFQENQRKEG